MRAFVALSCLIGLNSVHAQFDRPWDVVATDTGALVANRGSGQITLVDRSGAVKAAADIGKGTSAICRASLESATDFLATEDGALLRLRLNGRQLSVVGRLKLHQPEELAVDHDSGMAVVTSKWNAAAYIVRVVPKLEFVRTLDLGFSPGLVISLGNGRFLIADAFGGEMAVLQSDAGRVQSRCRLRGHNIRGLLRNDNEVLMGHQILSQTARTELADVHWGALMQNVISRVSIDSLVQGKPKASTIALGDVENGAADPADMVRLRDGRLAIALSGVDEILISSLPDRRGRFRFAKGTRIKVGRRPISMALLQDDTIVVTNELGHSVSIVNAADATVTTVPDALPRDLSAAERGERAFFSARLSHDKWLSCHSCHSSGHSPGLLADTLGDNAFGNPKLIPSLLGIGTTTPFGWSGNFEHLPTQIEKSIRTTMHGNPGENTAADIAAYLRTLRPPSRLADPARRFHKGRQAFEKYGCSKCHVPDNGFTSTDTYDVGFRDESGRSVFNPPSLRGIRHRRRFFHDGRATNLGQALQLHLTAMQKSASDEEIEALKHFLWRL